jgi:hypothetical protein
MMALTTPNPNGNQKGLPLLSDSRVAIPKKSIENKANIMVLAGKRHAYCRCAR